MAHPHLPTLAVALVLAALSLLFGCSGGGGGGGGQAPEAEATIGITGGVLEVTDASSPLLGVRLEIPAGAVASDTHFSISVPSTLPPLDPGDRPAAPFVSVGPSGVVFMSPAQLTLPYSDSDDNGVVDATGTSELLLAILIGTGSTWEYSENASIAPVTDTVSLNIEHLSLFGITLSRKLTSGPIKVYIDPASQHLTPGEVSIAGSTMSAALVSGLWEPKLACLGWDVIREDNRSAADVAVEWGSVPGVGGNCPNPSPCPHAPAMTDKSRVPWRIVLAEEMFGALGGPGWNLDPAVPPGGGIDLFSAISHEFAHLLGLPGCNHLDGRSLPGPDCNLVPFSDGAVIASRRSLPECPAGTALRQLHPFDEAFFAVSYSVLFSELEPMGTVGFSDTGISFVASSPCDTTELDRNKFEIRLFQPPSQTALAVFHSSELTFTPIGAGLAVELPSAGFLPEGQIRVEAVGEDMCHRADLVEWTFTVGPPPPFFETFEAASVGSYPPDAVVRGSEGSWTVQDTVSEFPEDCGTSPHRAHIEIDNGDRRLRLQSFDTDSGCSDNVYVLHFNAIPLVPGTRVSFTETGALHQPEVSGFNPHLGDRISLGVADNQGHVILYTPQHAPGLVPFEGPTGIFDVDMEYFVTPSAGTDFYIESVFAHFALLPSFVPQNAAINTLLFEVHDHGEATIDDIAVGVQ
jgi:hypothetical protein